MTLVMFAGVFMEGIEEGAGAQNTWPDHAGRPNNKLTKKPTKTESKALRSKCKEDLVAYGGGLVVEYALCEGDIVWIESTSIN